jgi:hypothetical protein
VRNPSVTHLIDADQRNVELPFSVADNGADLQVALPANHAVLPPGPYMLFVNRKGDNGLVPSKAAQAFVDPGLTD